MGANLYLRYFDPKQCENLRLIFNLPPAKSPFLDEIEDILRETDNKKDLNPTQIELKNHINTFINSKQEPVDIVAFVTHVEQQLIKYQENQAVESFLDHIKTNMQNDLRWNYFDSEQCKNLRILLRLDPAKDPAEDNILTILAAAYERAPKDTYLHEIELREHIRTFVISTQQPADIVTFVSNIEAVFIKFDLKSNFPVSGTNFLNHINKGRILDTRPELSGFGLYLNYLGEFWLGVKGVVSTIYSTLISSPSDTPYTRPHPDAKKITSLSGEKVYVGEPTPNNNEEKTLQKNIQLTPMENQTNENESEEVALGRLLGTLLNAMDKQVQIFKENKGSVNVLPTILNYLNQIEKILPSDVADKFILERHHELNLTPLTQYEKILFPSFAQQANYLLACQAEKEALENPGKNDLQAIADVQIREAELKVITPEEIKIFKLDSAESRKAYRLAYEAERQALEYGQIVYSELATRLAAAANLPALPVDEKMKSQLNTVEKRFAYYLDPKGYREKADAEAVEKVFNTDNLVGFQLLSGNQELKLLGKIYERAQKMDLPLLQNEIKRFEDLAQKATDDTELSSFAYYLSDGLKVILNEKISTIKNIMLYQDFKDFDKLNSSLQATVSSMMQDRAQKLPIKSLEIMLERLISVRNNPKNINETTTAFLNNLIDNVVAPILKKRLDAIENINIQGIPLKSDLIEEENADRTALDAIYADILAAQRAKTDPNDQKLARDAIDAKTKADNLANKTGFSITDDQRTALVNGTATLNKVPIFILENQQSNMHLLITGQRQHHRKHNANVADHPTKFQP